MTVLFLPKRSLSAGVCIVLSASVWAQTTATPAPLLVKRDAPLYKTANEQSEAVTQLPAQTRVTAQGQRQGAWVQVKTEQGISGWLRLFQLGQIPSNTAANQPDGWTRGFGSWWGTPTANRNQAVATSTIGIRGLEASDIAKAQPNPAAVTQAEGQRVDAPQAQQFAQRSGLQSRQVADLPNTSPSAQAPARDIAH